jgi:hypothetical protein
VSFPDPVAALAVLALGWAVLTPLICWIAVLLDERLGLDQRPDHAGAPAA